MHYSYKHLIWCSLLPIISAFTVVNAQESSALAVDTTTNEKPCWTNSPYVRQSIVPVGLAATSLSILAFPNLKYSIQDQLNWNKAETVVLYDDLLRYVPMGGAVLLSITGVKGKHPILDQVALGGFAYVLADFVVYRTKVATHVTRPAPSTEQSSFPSQHTSVAFVGATMLHREFGHLSPWISVAGYTMAAWVGYARIARNRHFMTDVLMGAAVGTMVTNATYWMYDTLMPKLKEKLSLRPNLGPEGAEIQLSYNF